MRRVFALTGAVALLGLGAAALPISSTRGKTERVMVHCPAGNNPGFVTPAQVRIAEGDSVEWRMTGQVTSDSIEISLKDPQQVWPFAGAPSRGGSSARANAARTKGTYGYNVTLQCRVPGGGTREVVIDPDIIIL